MNTNDKVRFILNNQPQPLVPTVWRKRPPVYEALLDPQGAIKVTDRGDDFYIEVHGVSGGFSVIDFNRTSQTWEQAATAVLDSHYWCPLTRRVCDKRDDFALLQYMQAAYDVATELAKKGDK